MQNRGSTTILTNLVEVHPRNIHTKFEANPCSGLREEVEKLKNKLIQPNTQTVVEQCMITPATNARCCRSGVTLTCHH